MVQAISETKRKAINLKLNLHEEGFLEVNLFDLTGELVYNYANFVKEGTREHQISCSGLKAKEYLLRISQNGSSEVKKLLVH